MSVADTLVESADGMAQGRGKTHVDPVAAFTRTNSLPPLTDLRNQRCESSIHVGESGTPYTFPAIRVRRVPARS